MNSNLRTEPLGVAILALAFATIALSACTDDPADLGTTAVASFIGTQPAEPTARSDAPTPVEPGTGASRAGAAGESDMGKQQASKSMPLPGQANDHSTLAPDASQKSGPAPATPTR